jgi:carnitine O-palmitoyltransferase 1
MLMQFPWLENFPLLPRLGLLAAYTSLSIAVIIATLQRVLIRILLNYKGFLYNARKPTLGMKAWFFVMKLLVGNRKHSLYNFQSVLPSLPVPSLKDTCRRYLASVKNLQTPEQFKRTQVCD